METTSYLITIGTEPNAPLSYALGTEHQHPNEYTRVEWCLVREREIEIEE